MSRRVIPVVPFAALAMLGACSGWLRQGSEDNTIAAPTITIVGALGGKLVLTPGQSKTIFANEAGYYGKYSFTIADASVATISVPAGFSTRHRDAGGSSITVNQGAATVTADGVGATTLTVEAGADSVSVPISVVRPPATPTPTPTVTPTPTPTPAPTATPNPPPTAPLMVNATALTFKTSNPQTVLVTEAGYSGVLSETDNCAGIATIGPTSSTSPYTANVTPLGAGSCTINFTDGTQVVPVVVNVL